MGGGGGMVGRGGPVHGNYVIKEKMINWQHCYIV